MSIYEPRGPMECDLRVLATATSAPERLQQASRLTPELAAKLRKRHVHIPSLKERGPDDVCLLCEDLVRRISLRQRLGAVPQIETGVMRILTGRNWPGNFSDLVRVLEYAVLHCRGGVIRRAHLPAGIESRVPPAGETLDEIVADAQRTAIRRAIEETGSVTEAAKRLGRNRANLHRLMKKLGMTTEHKL